MKHLNKLIRVTSYVAFKKIHKQWFLYCKALQSKIIVTNMFWRHISWSAKKRDMREILSRFWYT